MCRKRRTDICSLSDSEEVCGKVRIIEKRAKQTPTSTLKAKSKQSPKKQSQKSPRFVPSTTICIKTDEKPSGMDIPIGRGRLLTQKLESNFWRKSNKFIWRTLGWRWNWLEHHASIQIQSPRCSKILSKFWNKCRHSNSSGIDKAQRFGLP